MKTQPDSLIQKIRTIYIGTFLVDAQVDPRATGSHELRFPALDLPVGFSGTSSPQQFVDQSKLHINDHRIGLGRRNVTEPILDLTMTDAISTRFLSSPLGTGFVMVESESNYDSGFERSLEDSLAVPIKTISQWVPGAFPGLIGGERPNFLLPGGQLLWWHRVVPLSSAMEMKSHLWGAKTTKSQNQFEVAVGDGFTWVSDNLLHEKMWRDHVVRGLMAATDDWLLADNTNKQLRNYVESVEKAIQEANHSRIELANQEGEKLTQQGQYLRLFLDERDRNLVLLAGEVWGCAREAWGLTGELSNLDTKISLIHNQATIAASRLQQNRDSYRNGVLFTIALLAALQGILILMDFAVNQDIAVLHPLRGWISLALLLTTLGVGVEIARRWVAQRRKPRAGRQTRREPN